MANYQPNYIYSPLYGNRYMGGSRTPAPSTGGAGQVDTSSIQSRNTAVGVPYSPVVQEKPLGPVGWSSTGRDQSVVESLGNFGFRDMSGLTMDPFEGTDYISNGFGSPAPINTRYVESVPEPQVTAPVSFDSGSGGDDYTSNYSYDNQSVYSRDSTPTNNDETIAALYSYGVGYKDTPDLVQALKPGAYLAKGAANMMTWQKNEEELAALDKYNAVMDPVTGQPNNPNIKAIVNPDGTITYDYVEGSTFDGNDLSADQFGALQAQDNVSVSGLDAAGNVNVTVTNPDGTTYDARAGVSPTTGQVNTYNFNVKDTVTTQAPSNPIGYTGPMSVNDAPIVGPDGTPYNIDTVTASTGSNNTTTSSNGFNNNTSNTAASEDAYSTTPSSPQTTEELDADSMDNGSGGNDSGGKS